MTGFASRWTMPSRSSVWRVCVSIFSLTPSMARRSSLKRYERSISSMRTSTPQRLVTCSMTRRYGHLPSPSTAVYLPLTSASPLTAALTVM